jgi:hypothetical protein
MEVPSWVESVPGNFGDAAAGTLKAAEWRVLATIYLPVALVNFWGEGTQHADNRLAKHMRRVLDHTMSLVSAVVLVTLRSMSPYRASAYRNHIITYIRDLREIHPQSKHRPNHHMAVHIYDFLHLFGPVRSWWTFPFERLIGHIQRLPTNHHFGELEQTLLRTFVRACNLKRWLTRPDCPEVIRECKTLFDRAFMSLPHNDSDVLDDDNSGQMRTPSDLFPLVNQHSVALHSQFWYKGRRYTKSTTHVGNSLIHFYANGSTSSLIPGSIKYIYTSPQGSLVFAVQRQLAITDGTLDPFRHYPNFPVQLYSSKLSNTLEIVKPEWLKAHFARWPISEEHAVVLSLSLVSVLSSQSCPG